MNILGLLTSFYFYVNPTLLTYIDNGGRKIEPNLGGFIVCLKNCIYQYGMVCIFDLPICIYIINAHHKGNSIYLSHIRPHPYVVLCQKGLNTLIILNVCMFSFNSYGLNIRIYRQYINHQVLIKLYKYATSVNYVLRLNLRPFESKREHLSKIGFIGRQLSENIE